MKKVVVIASVGYALYAFGVAIFIYKKTSAIWENWKTITAGPSFSTLSLVPLILFIVIGLVVILMLLILSYFLIKRKNRKASLILAGISCIGIPVGTILGALTIFALTRQEIKKLYN